MNLLLLLSALMSALTGVGTGMRAVQPAMSVARAAEPADAVRPTARLSASRPVAALPLPTDVAVATGTAWRIAPAAPLYLSRRRE